MLYHYLIVNYVDATNQVLDDQILNLGRPLWTKMSLALLDIQWMQD